MRLLSPDQIASLRDWFLPDQPGPMVGLHVLHTGNGACFADRWPQPRAVLVESGGNFSLAGDPAALGVHDLRQRDVSFLDAPPTFEPLIRAACSNITIWERIILRLDSAAPVAPQRSPEVSVRVLGKNDAYHVFGLSSDVAWISNTWGGPAGLASSGRAWGAFVEDRLAAVACSFYVGAQYEDIGVVTEAPFRGLGLSPTCVWGLCEDIGRRGKTPSWSTSPDNVPSLRVAEKLGFHHVRNDRLFVIDQPPPPPAQKSD